MKMLAFIFYFFSAHIVPSSARAYYMYGSMIKKFVFSNLNVLLRDCANVQLYTGCAVLIKMMGSP